MLPITVLVELNGVATFYWKNKEKFSTTSKLAIWIMDKLSFMYSKKFYFEIDIDD